MTKICVFCSSMSNLSQDYVEVARRTGELLGKRNHQLIYGGSHRGLMGELSKSFVGYGQEIIEIIPKMWEDIVITKRKAIVTKDLGERLKKMQEISEAFITLPGGLGCLQEFGDVLVSRQLNIHLKPLTIVNTNGFYDNLIEQINKIVSEGFAPLDNKGLFYVASTPEKALDYIEKYNPLRASDK